MLWPYFSSSRTGALPVTAQSERYVLPLASSLCSASSAAAPPPVARACCLVRSLPCLPSGSVEAAAALAPGPQPRAPRRRLRLMSERDSFE